MRRHYKMKHPYIFYKESVESQRAFKKRLITRPANKVISVVVSTSEAEGKKENETDDAVSIEALLPKTVITRASKKRRSVLWKHFAEFDKNFVRCKLCDAKLRDNHHNAVMHLNRRHRKEFEELGDFNILPFQQRSNILWTFFVDEGNRFVRCKLCNKTMRKNMSTHLQTEHPDDFERAMSTKRDEVAKYCEPPPPRNWVKKYCTSVADGHYRCNECGLILKLKKGLYGNMRRHIKNKHASIYYEEMIAEKADKGNKDAKINLLNLLEANYNSDTLGSKDPLADFDLGSPTMTETEIATNFLQNDNLESALCSEINLDTTADLPVLVPCQESESYVKSYFLLVEDSLYKCIQCDESIHCPDIGDQEALYTHIRDKHPEEIITLHVSN